MGREHNSLKLMVEQFRGITRNTNGGRERPHSPKTLNYQTLKIRNKSKK